MITLILTLALVGLLTWAVVTYVPMPGQIKTLIIAVVVILLILYVLGAIGFVDLAIPRVHR